MSGRGPSARKTATPIGSGSGGSSGSDSSGVSATRALPTTRTYVGDMPPWFAR